ncbi:MAG: tetratricopeptide repeat protein [Actinomycetota bacterium]
MNVVFYIAAGLVAGAGLVAVGLFTRASRVMIVLAVLASTLASVPAVLSDEVRTSDVAVEPAEREDPIDFFARRVRRSPNDVGARSDLAAELLSAGNFRGAMTEYLAVLQLDPENADAHARVALLLFRGGLTKPALRSVERALTLRPDLPEALYVKGLITMMGLKKPNEAKKILRLYLEVAPFGAYVADVERLLEIEL